jgi:hypothetical protein
VIDVIHDYSSAKIQRYFSIFYGSTTNSCDKQFECTHEHPTGNHAYSYILPIFGVITLYGAQSNKIKNIGSALLFQSRQQAVIVDEQLSIHQHQDEHDAAQSQNIV